MFAGKLEVGELRNLFKFKGEKYSGVKIRNWVNLFQKELREEKPLDFFYPKMSIETIIPNSSKTNCHEIDRGLVKSSSREGVFFCEIQKRNRLIVYPPKAYRPPFWSQKILP